ncbi:MAG: hypothetical protein KGL39_45840 [Patescibacteria group bacterium]|nr:hypothetical protein [Patescibacteria group bacterium]
MTVELTVELTPEAQKKCLLAGVNAAKQQTLALTVESADDLSSDLVIVRSDGSARIHSPGQMNWAFVPTTVSEALRAITEYQREEASSQREAAFQRVEQCEADPARYCNTSAPTYGLTPEDAVIVQARWQAAIDRHYDALLAEWAASDDPSWSKLSGRMYDAAERASQQIKDLVLKAREDDNALKAAAEAETQRKAALLQADVDRGFDAGWTFAVTAGMASFLKSSRTDENAASQIWVAGQSKRWVGAFTRATTIDRFLSKSAEAFSLDGIGRFDCIQLSGFSTNSRGRRRNVSDTYAVVVAVSDEKITICLAESRAQALSVAKKLSKKSDVVANGGGQ